MAATRPVVLVYQEFATLSGSPASPELNVCIAGPAYHIQDFPADRATCKATQVYGVKDAAATGVSVAPAAGSVHVDIAEVPGNRLGAVLDAASVQVFFGALRAEIAHVATATTTVNSPNVTGVFDYEAAGVKAGDVVLLTDTNSTPRTLVRKVRSVTGTTLQLTSEVPPTVFTAGASTKVRVERDLTDVQVPASFVVTPGGNQVQVKGDVSVSVSGVSKKVSWAEVFVAYRSLRQDLADVKTLSPTANLEAAVGRVDARNPLAVGLSVARKNSNTTLQYFGIQTDDAEGYSAFKGAIGARKDIYAVVPLTSDLSVVASFKNDFEAQSDPELAKTQGVPQKFRVVIGGGVALPTVKELVQPNTDGSAQVKTGTTPTGAHTITLASPSPALSFLTLGVKPGDKICLDTTQATDVYYTVSQVNSALELEVDETLAAAGPTVGAAVRLATTGDTQLWSGTATVTTKVDDELYLELYDANGAFLDDGVLTDDLVEIPVAGADYSSVHRLLVESVLSNQRILLANKGRNLSSAVRELPHGSVTTFNFRVVRALDKDGQVEALKAVAQSLKHRRAILCWPDSVEVAGLKQADADAPPQPGYYLACAVGGMTASLPSHQGFTNLGIAGIERIYNANGYFDDKQLTAISNGGWFVFQQDSLSALPYCIHQLTTDPATLQTGEFSLVKNFDYVSLFYGDILNEFVGVWNMTPETFGFVGTAINAGTDNLKLRRKPRIGAPIIDATITSLGESTVSEDRLELYVEVDFPKPLNTVGLHLVSV